MGSRKLSLPTIHLVRRESAEWYMVLTLLSFAASVTFTRLFLSLTGYPQIGGGELHIAHVLWGGLLLYTGALIPLIFSNRGVYPSAAILAGIGVGLFIDEVGKFITQSNDYFFPLAAPIIYAVFLLSIIFLLLIRRSAYSPKNAALDRALDEIRVSLHERPTEDEWEQMKTDLRSFADKPPSPRHAELAQALLKFVETDPAPIPLKRRLRIRPPRKLINLPARWLPDRRLRWLLILGLLGIGLQMWKNPLSVLLGDKIGGNVVSFLARLRIGQQIEIASTAGWFKMRLGLEVLVGLLLLVAATVLLTRHKRLGAIIGIIGLLASLTTVNLLLFYFEQFSTIITTMIQFLLLIGLFYYHSRLSSKIK